MNEEFNFAVKTAEKTGGELLKYFGNADDSLARNTSKGFKTAHDNIADDIIKKGIEKNFPIHSIFTEETGMIDKHSDYLWIIDPLDGTGNFVNNNPFFTVSIALWHKGEPVFGIMEASFLGRRFFARRGKGAWVIDFKRGHKSRARVSSIKELKNSYFVTCEGGEKNKKRTADIFYYIYRRVKELRKIGSATIECSWVGTGKADAYYTPKCNLYDVAAGLLFVKEAGGRILDFNLKPYKWADFNIRDKFDLIIANKNLKLPKLNKF
ncbi:MAG: inositol monophosphatase family protein [Patescibacteria group bacterium]|jgi:myo-inositol-1(or 4)-monophosphatase